MSLSRLTSRSEIFSRYNAFVEQLCTKIYDALVSSKHSFKNYDKDNAGFVTVDKFAQMIKDVRESLSTRGY